MSHMASTGRRCAAVAAALLLLCMVHSAAAGKNNQGRAGKPVPEHLRFRNHVAAPLRRKSDLPKSFDWCNLNGVNYCAANWNQHIPQYCGSCYAHGTLSMIQDRLKIAKKAKSPDVMLGRQTLLNCAPLEGYGNGCDGGDTFDVFGYMSEFGLPDEGCLPYNATDNTKWTDIKHCPPEGQCMNCMPVDGVETCWPIERYIKYYTTAWGNLDKGEEAMMAEIFHRGPITCGMACPEDFTWHYQGGVYVDKSGDDELDHDVEVVGWGEEDGKPYWIVRNSWGAYWGEVGFFRAERGHNGLQLESGDCWYAEVDWQVERDIHNGRVHGSMYGLRNKNEPDLQKTAVEPLPKLADVAAEITRSAFPEVWSALDRAEGEVLAKGAEEDVAVARRMLH